MAIGYFGVKLSDNVVKTPEGYLVFKNAVIARTGFYTYKGCELLDDEVTAEELEDQGVTLDRDAEVKVYRSPEEVFSKRSIDSFQGKPVTDGHPPNMLDLEDVKEHECGQVFNVREGKEPLEDGNMPLLGDIIIKSSALIQKWEAGLRELSNGYNYHILKQGDILCQVDIVGNHVAFVESGRAGKHARVNDSKPTTGVLTMEQQHEIAFGEGLKHVAEKSTGAQFGAFLKSLNIFAGVRKGAAMDEDAPKDDKKEADATDAAMDAKAKDRAKYHAALDRKMDARDSAAEEAAASEDADMTELENMFGKGKDESVEEKEEESAATDDDGDEDDDEGEATDGLEDNASEPIAPADRPQKDTPSATDAAYAAGAAAVLKALKPHVAKAANKSLNGAFDTASKLVSGKSVGTSGGYGKFAKAAGKTNDSAIAEGKSDVDKQIAAAEKAYVESRKAKLNFKR